MALPALAEQALVAGIGEYVLNNEPAAMLVAYGLGSCVALAAWDPFVRVGGLAHFMLPTRGPVDPASPVKYVDGGLEVFLGAFQRAGGALPRTVFKLAGGAATLPMSAGLEIGRRNGEAIAAGLERAGLRVTAQDLGGRAGRTVQLHVGTGRLLVRSVSTAHEL